MTSGHFWTWSELKLVASLSPCPCTASSASGTNTRRLLTILLPILQRTHALMKSDRCKDALRQLQRQKTTRWRPCSTWDQALLTCQVRSNIPFRLLSKHIYTAENSKTPKYIISRTAHCKSCDRQAIAFLWRKPSVVHTLPCLAQPIHALLNTRGVENLHGTRHLEV